MIDIGKTNVTINCPNCRRAHTVALRDIEHQRSVRCTCGTNIRLVDKNASTARGIRETNRGFADLERSLKRIGNIKVKF